MNYTFVPESVNSHIDLVIISFSMTHIIYQ